MLGRVATVLLVLMLAATLAALGRWGRVNGAVLLPAFLADDERERRLAVVRRGGAACYVGAIAMSAVAVLAVL